VAKEVAERPREREGGSEQHDFQKRGHILRGATCVAPESPSARGLASAVVQS